MAIAFYVKDYECNARWSYTGFNRFRKKIAKSINIDLDEMVGFMKNHPVDSSFMKPGWREWDGIKSPLKALLNHSDCKGKLTSEECAMIAPTLKVILFMWEEIDTIYDSHDSYDKENGLKLVAAMEHCASFGKELEFR